MRDTKLEQIFRSLNAKEKRAFADFVASPFFNKRDDAIQLHRWLASGEPLEPTEKVFAHLFPGAKYDKQRLLLTMSHLQRLAEQFVACRHWQEKPAAYETELLQALRHRGLDLHFAEALRTVRTECQSSAYCRPLPFRNLFLSDSHHSPCRRMDIQ